MDKQQLDEFLFTHTPQENYYAEHKGSFTKRLEKYEPVLKNGKEVFLIQTVELNHRPVYIRKDSRYSFMPFHSYDVINLNYIYSGECSYWIDGKEVVLKKGDVCIFDTGVVRSKMRQSYDDIIINILVTDDFFKRAVNTINETNLMSMFLANTIAINSNHDNYIIFKTEGNQKIESLFENLLIAYFEDNTYSSAIVQNYLSILIIELLRLYQDNLDKHIVRFSSPTSEALFGIATYIENHYQNCSLKELSDKFGYHEKYICHLLKKNYDLTFKQIQTNYRLSNATDLLRNSKLPIKEISEQVGFSNHNLFYRLFKEKYHMLPKDYRNSNKPMDDNDSNQGD